MAYAVASDVQARLGRPLTTDETTQVTTLLADAEILIKAKISDLAEKAENEDYLAVVKMVEASAVARLLRNPEGYTGETDGNYTYQVNYRLATGALEITDKEWSLLGVSSGMFMIVPRVQMPFCRVPLGSGG
jgi:hypothetical protein